MELMAREVERTEFSPQLRFSEPRKPCSPDAASISDESTCASQTETPSTVNRSPKSWADLSEDFNDSDEGPDFCDIRGSSGQVLSFTASTGGELGFPSLIKQPQLPTESCSSTRLAGRRGGSRRQGAAPAVAWKNVEAECPSDDEQSWSAKPGEWSVGAANHATNSCRPCIFFPKSNGCENGESCEFCHLEHSSRVAHRRQHGHRRRHRGGKGGAANSLLKGTAEESDEEGAGADSGVASTLIAASSSQDVQKSTESTAAPGTAKNGAAVSSWVTSLMAVSSLFYSSSTDENAKSVGVAANHSQSRGESEVSTDAGDSNTDFAWKEVKARSASEDEKGWIDEDECAPTVRVRRR